MRSGSCTFELSGKEVHVWAFNIGTSATIGVSFEQTLDVYELDRAARFHFSRHRESFVLTHVVLRHVLGRYLNLHPSSVRFSYGPRGKPALAPTTNLQFNMSHSASMAVIALTTDCQIGVDIEQIRPVTNMEQLAERFFCLEEAAEIISLPVVRREQAFFSCWTRKEAYIKAIGTGLSTPLNAFRVRVQPDAPAHFLHIQNETAAAEEWTLHDLQLAPNYAAAVTYQDQQRSLSIFPVIDIAEFLSSP
jgi:4'-phosphopantetheinyl transferase